MTISRSDENFARRTAELFIPDINSRKECLSIFANSIIKAHNISQASWATTIYPNKEKAIRLTIGMIYVCNIYPNGISLTLYAPDQKIDPLRPFLSLDNIVGLENVQKGKGPVPTAPHFPSLPEAVWCWFKAKDIHLAWPLVRCAYNKAIAASLLKRVNPGSRQAHAQGVVEYLRSELNLVIPDPNFRFSGFNKNKTRYSSHTRDELIADMLMMIENHDIGVKIIT